LKAADLCDKIVAATGGPTWGEKAVFLGPWSGKTIADWTPQVRQREIQILTEAKRLDAEMIKELEKALALLK
jgi:hypothetical protein